MKEFTTNLDSSERVLADKMARVVRGSKKFYRLEEVVVRLRCLTSMGGAPTAIEKEADLFKILDILGPVGIFYNSSSGVVVRVCDEASLRCVFGKAVGGEGTLLKECMKQLGLFARKVAGAKVRDC